VTATSPGGPDVTATATADTPLPAAPSIALVKVGTFQDENSDGDADEGETIRYTFAVKNTGSVTLHNVRVVDRMSGVTISGNPTTLGAGETDATTFRGVYFIRQADIDAGHFFNEALALSDESQPASAAEDVDLPQNPSLKIVKDAAVPGGTANVPDEVIDYTISVQNTGNTTLTGVTVVDPFVTDLTRVADNPGNTDMRLEVGETWVYTATHTVTMADIVSNHRPRRLERDRPRHCQSVGAGDAGVHRDRPGQGELQPTLCPHREPGYGGTDPFVPGLRGILPGRRAGGDGQCDGGRDSRNRHGAGTQP